MAFDPAIANTLGFGTTATAGSRMGKPDLTQADFLRLMTEQLKNQDPLKPLSNAEFVSQMAQMSTAQGVGDLRTSLDGMAEAISGDQALRGAALIGRNALVETDRLALVAGPEDTLSASGVAAAPGAGTITVDITTANGALVRRLQIPAERAGDVAFTWDGTNAQGQAMPPGTYRMRAVFGEGRDAQAVGTAAMAPVESVTLDPQGLLLNLGGLGTAPLSAVRRIS
ncbi:MAG: flagellar hook capping FlgD N-terminal domain-containing protein [Lysobacteraceae bacterium]|jgi:flagellar basal-body rod modification protein FlgD|nr:flagellar hook assembly protein FlgD [Xanthomonadaceae bacterium]MCZ8319498.1 flagellar hook assembly protein FlgD [Silanimonas sp.]